LQRVQRDRIDCLELEIEGVEVREDVIDAFCQKTNRITEFRAVFGGDELVYLLGSRPRQKDGDARKKRHEERGGNSRHQDGNGGKQHIFQCVHADGHGDHPPLYRDLGRILHGADENGDVGTATDNYGRNQQKQSHGTELGQDVPRSLKRHGEHSIGVSALDVSPDDGTAEREAKNQQGEGDERQGEGNAQLLGLAHGEGADGRHEEDEKEGDRRQCLQNPVANDPSEVQGEKGSQMRAP